MEKKDNKEILIKRLISILSYHEKGGVWKKMLYIIIYITYNRFYC